MTTASMKEEYFHVIACVCIVLVCTRIHPIALVSSFASVIALFSISKTPSAAPSAGGTCSSQACASARRAMATAEATAEASAGSGDDGEGAPPSVPNPRLQRGGDAGAAGAAGAANAENGSPPSFSHDGERTFGAFWTRARDPIPPTRDMASHKRWMKAMADELYGHRTGG